MQGILSAKLAYQIVLGGFVMSSKIEEYIKNENPKIVTIVAMDGPNSEDDFFAEYLVKRLTNQPIHFDEIMQSIKNPANAQRFLNPKYIEFSEQDFYLSLALNRFDFLAKVESNGKRVRIKKVVI